MARSNSRIIARSGSIDRSPSIGWLPMTFGGGPGVLVGVGIGVFVGLAVTLGVCEGEGVAEEEGVAERVGVSVLVGARLWVGRGVNDDKGAVAVAGLRRAVTETSGIGKGPSPRAHPDAANAKPSKTICCKSTRAAFRRRVRAKRMDDMRRASRSPAAVTREGMQRAWPRKRSRRKPLRPSFARRRTQPSR